MDIQFQTPWLLYLIWTVPALAALWVVIQRRARRALDAFVAPAMQAKLIPPQRAARQYWQTALVAIGSLLLLLAAAGPRWGEREETVLHQSRDLVIAMDVSFSMLANDVHPSRLERAKVDAMDLISSLKGDRAALLAFRAKPALVCPLTTDYAFLRQALAGIGTGSAPRGETDIGAAISRALDAFSETEASHKAILLISDGEDLSGLAIEMAETAGKRGIPIYTIGIGSRAGSTIPDPQNPGEVIRFEGKPVTTRLDHESLLTIARKSGGSYIPVETAGTTSTTLGTIYSDHLRNVSRRELAESRRRRAVERYQWFLLPAFLLLSAACTLSRGRLATGPRKPALTAATLLLAWFLPAGILPCIAAASTNANALPVSTSPSNLQSQVSDPGTPASGSQPAPSRLTGHAAAREAQRLYRKGDFEAAAGLYHRAAQDSPRDTGRTYLFNEGAALAGAGKFKDSADIFRSLSLQGRRGELDAAPALGNVLYQEANTADAGTPEGAESRATALRLAGEAFKEAWRTDSESEARHDLALTLKQLPAAEENAKALRLAKQYEKTPAPDMAAEMLKIQRELASAIALAATNAVPERIAAFEALAQRQRDNADRWMPLKAKLAEALAQQNGQQQNEEAQKAIRALYALMDLTRDNMRDGHLRLRDIDTEAFRPVKLAEQGTYQLWKAVAPHEGLLREGIVQQTNAIEQVSGKQTPDPVLTTSALQQESAALTDLFRTRFEQAVPPEGTVPAKNEATEAAADGNTNGVPAPEGITPEVRRKIMDLAAETAGIQRHAAEHIAKGASSEALASQMTARDKLLEIADLLPKPPPQQQQQPPPEQKPPEQKPEQQPEPQPEAQQQENPEKQPEPSVTPENEDDVQKLLRRAMEREREFEEEKRRRQNRIPLPPSARDW